jgi:hypothetical protein
MPLQTTTGTPRERSVLRLVEVETTDPAGFAREVAAGREIFMRIGVEARLRAWQATYAGSDVHRILLTLEFADGAAFARSENRLLRGHRRCRVRDLGGPPRRAAQDHVRRAPRRTLRPRLDHQMTTLELAFEARGATGSVSIDVRTNIEPASIGCTSETAGFPICKASVSTSLQGIQRLPRLGPSRRKRPRRHVPQRRFEINPLQIFEGLDMPFGFHGLEPTLFDAPSRRDRHQTLDWLAPQLPVPTTGRADGPRPCNPSQRSNGGSACETATSGSSPQRCCPSRPGQHTPSSCGGPSHLAIRRVANTTDRDREPDTGRPQLHGSSTEGVSQLRDDPLATSPRQHPPARRPRPGSGHRARHAQ